MLDRSSKRTLPLWHWGGLAVNVGEGRAPKSSAPINVAKSRAEQRPLDGRMTAEIAVLNR
jgi:hypothetical protein